MEVKLYGYGEEIDNIFSLLGKNENDITKSISYTFYKCPTFLQNFINEVIPNVVDYSLNNIVIQFQEYHENGITDIEIYEEGNFKIIIEAKSGFKFPTREQLFKYEKFLINDNFIYKKILSLSELNTDTAKNYLKEYDFNTPLDHITYKQLRNIAVKSIRDAKNKEKDLLHNFINYLTEVIPMQNKHSNIVYVVSINGDSIRKHDIDRIYSCPVGGRFLKEPTNYIGFRYGGKLRYINFVERTEVFIDNGKNYFRFQLGPDIVPNKEIRTGGKIRNTKLYCDIDLLLTCNTIVEASRINKQRHSEE